MSKPYKHRYRAVETWWTRDTGGLPGWAIVASGSVLTLIGAFVAFYSISGA